MRIYGPIMLRGEIFKGTLEVRDGEIRGVWRRKERYDFKGTVIPTFINMHTHLGDYYYAHEPRGTLEEVVGPDGLKFRILQNEEMVLRGMQEALNRMERCGTSHFVDFREGGREGVLLLRHALEGRKIRGIILGRGDLWDEADGIGISSICDVPYDHALEMSEKARKAGKIFALHASEAKREDVDKILSLRPHFIVHFLEASEEDIKAVAEHRIPVVLTPRANAFWGRLPNIPRMIRHGISVALGTDNGMVASPCMFREMEFAYRISRLLGGVSPEYVLNMATYIPRKILGIEDNEVDGPARLIVFRDVLSPYLLVTRASCGDIYRVILP